MTSFIKRYVFHNFALKLMSLLLGTGLWFMISLDEQPAEVEVRAPIVFQHVPRNLEISSDYVPEAEIRVRGPERVIRQLRSNDIQAEIDLAEAKPEERTYELTSQQVRHPHDLTVMQVVPSQVHLSFDTRLTRVVPINPRVTGVEFVQATTDPPSVTITGPRQHVERIESATTDPIDATGTRGRAVFTTNAYVSDPLVQVENASTIRVIVTVQTPGAVISH